MKVNDTVPGTILVVFAAGIFYQTLDFPPMPGQDYGPALFPRIIAVLMAISGGLLIAKGVARRRGEPLVTPADWMLSPRHLLNFVLLLALTLFYIFAAKELGFIPTAFLVLSLLILRLRGPAGLGTTLGIAAVASLGMQQFFGQLLRVPLPWGIVPPFSW